MHPSVAIPGTRSEVRHHERSIRVWLDIRTQWDQDHWIAEYHGITATGDNEIATMHALEHALERKRWMIDA